ncbi:MAG TPA: hypothetical protein ENK78_00980 [Thiothrix sp.]|nr:hypothetical protein [Thiothrix sp.]
MKKNTQLNDTEQQLLTQFNALSSEQQQSVLDFVDFLAARQATSDEISKNHEQSLLNINKPTPLAIPRPAKENVVKAIKRLTATYPMLNPDDLLHQTSDLMSAHIIQGRSAQEVIDELETIFQSAYQKTYDNK